MIEKTAPPMATVSRQKLVDAIEALLTVIPKHTGVPGLQCVRIAIGQDEVRLTGSDFDTTATLTLDATTWLPTAPPSVACVHARTLWRLLESADADKVCMRVGAALRVEVGECEAELEVLPDELGAEARGPSAPLVPIDDAFADELARVLPAVSNCESRSMLQGVCVSGHRIVATNGHHMLIGRLGSAPSLGDLIIRPKAAAFIVESLDNDELSVGREDNVLFIGADRALVRTRMIDGPYPAYDAVIPTTFVTEAEVDCEQLIEALRRLRVVASEQTGRVRLVFAGETCALSAASAYNGRARETIPAKMEGTDLTIYFNVKYLLSVLNAARTERCTLKCAGEEQAMLVECEDPAFTGLIMPLRALDVRDLDEWKVA